MVSLGVPSLNLPSFTSIQIVGEKFDHFDENQENKESRYYETMYALLDSISPGYTQSFGDALVQKLSSLQADVDDVADSNVPCEKTGNKTES